MAIATETPAAKWRNFLVWSGVSAVFFFAVWSVSVFMHGGSLGARLASEGAALKLGLPLIFGMAWVGYFYRNRSVSPLAILKFLVVTTLAGAIGFFIAWSAHTYARSGAFGVMGPSDWIAFGAGMVLVVISVVGSLQLAIAAWAPSMMKAEIVDYLRERGRLFFYSFMYLAANGLVLVVLSLANPGSMMSPVAALTGALVLFAAMILFWIIAWRLSDELMRTLTYESGNIAFYLLFLIGGGRAMLAHLGFVAAPTSLDWLTMLTTLSVAAAFIATARRGLLEQPGSTA